MPMNEQQTKVLLDRCAQSLRNACVQRTGMISVQGSKAARTPFRAPPARPYLALDGLLLVELPKALYQGHGLDPVHVLAAWDACCNLIVSSTKEALDRLQDLLPGVPLSKDHRHPRTALIQFLGVLSHTWPGEFTDSKAEVTLPVGKIGLDRHGLWWPGSYRRLVNPLHLAPRAIVQGAMGREHLARPDTTVLHQYLLRTLPDLQAEISLVVATAVHAKLERELVHAFDVDTDEAEPLAERTVWDDALGLIETAASPPYDALKRLLDPVLQRGQFYRCFGRPRGSKRYTPVTRDRHRAAVLKLRGAATNTSVSTAAHQQVADLLALQGPNR